MDGSAQAMADRAAATQPRPLAVRSRRAAMALALWGLGYACYRCYYAAGGTIGMVGRPVSEAQIRTINAAGAAIVLFAAALPVVLVRVAAVRPALPVLGWLGAVGCSMHALVDIVLRLLSVAGIHPTQLPEDVWLSFDRRAADLQDLLLNEPWFLVEGVLWAILGSTFVRAPRRRSWLLSIVGACLVLTAIGILSGLDVIGSFRLG